MWVANSGSNNVSKIDTATNTVIATVGVGMNPRALAFDGVYMWVANHVSNNVSRIEVTCDVVISPKGVGHGPCALAFDGVYMWAAISSYVSKVAAFDFRYFPYFSNPL
jgi:YVTN family beta-propeller protein